jgi:tetratricopeptide (TPR) repeat protein
VARGLEEADNDEARAHMRIARAWGFVYWFNPDQPDPVSREQRLAWAREGLAAAEQLDDPFLLTRAISALAALYFRAGNFGESLHVSLRLLDLVDRQPSRDAQAATLSSIGADMLTTTVEVARATELAERGYQLARGTSDHELMHSSGPFLRALFHVGRWSEIPSVVEDHLAAYANESRMTCPEVQFGPPFAARFFAEIGDSEREHATIGLLDDLLAEPAASGGRRSTAFVANQLAQYALVAGRLDDALALQEPLLPSAGPADLRDMAPAQIEILAALGRWAELREFVERVRPLISATPLLGAVIDRAQARALAAAGDHAAAVGLFESAITAFAALSCPFEVARTKELLAEVPGQATRRALLDDALATYESLGATPHAARVRVKLPAA